MRKEPLETLRYQGISHFELGLYDEANTGNIAIRKERKTHNPRFKYHVQAQSARLLCNNGCDLPENKGGITCTKIDPERGGPFNSSARISSKTDLSDTYWNALAQRIPCKPKVVKYG